MIMFRASKLVIISKVSQEFFAMKRFTEYIPLVQFLVGKS